MLSPVLQSAHVRAPLKVAHKLRIIGTRHCRAKLVTVGGREVSQDDGDRGAVDQGVVHLHLDVYLAGRDDSADGDMVRHLWRSLLVDHLESNRRELLDCVTILVACDRSWRGIYPFQRNLIESAILVIAFDENCA